MRGGGGGQLSGEATFRGSNNPAGNYPGGNYPRGNFSRENSPDTK